MDASWFINSGGKVVPVAPEQIDDATQLGWVPASPKQIEDARIQEKYGGQSAAAFAEAAGSALTFGLSTAAERGLGVPAEDIAGREKVNPLASGLGTGIGVLLGLKIPGFAPSLIAKAGKATAGLIPAGEALAGRVAARAAALGLGSAVEGAAYGAGQVVHEAALGDPNLTAESALATIGLSGAFAGTIGVAGGVLGELSKEGAKYLPAWLEDVEAHANLQAAGGDKVLARRLRDKFGDQGMKDLLLEMRDRGILAGPMSTPATVMARATELSKSAGSDIGDMLQQADTVVPRSMPRAALDDAMGVASKLSENPFEASTAKSLTDLLADYEFKFAASGGASLEELHKMEMEFGQQIYGLKGQRNPALNPYIQSLQRIRGTISDAVDEAVTNSGAVSDADWTEANRSFQVAKEAQKLAQNGMNRMAGNNPISASALLGGVAGAAASGPVGAVLTTAGTEVAKRYGSGLTGFAARALRNVIEAPAEEVINSTGSIIAAERAAGVDSVAPAATNAPETIAALSFLERNNQAIAQKIESGAKAVLRGAGEAGDVTPAMSAAEFTKHTDLYRGLAENPARMQAALEGQVHDLDAHAPKTSQALQIASARAASFLAQKVQQHPLAGPLAEAWEPTATELDQFQRYHDAIEKPTRLLRDAANGTLTQEAVEAVRSVYPALFAQMQSKLVEAMAGRREFTPQARLMLSMLLGQDVDGSLSGASILASQAQFQMHPAMPQGGVRPTAKGMGKIRTSTRMQTDLQRSAQRGAR